MPKNNIIDIKREENSPTEPCTMAELKAQLIISFTDDDVLIQALITQARRNIEEYCAVSIVSKTITFTADLYKEWELPYGPVSAIHGVSTRSGNEGSGPANYTTAATGWVTDGEDFKTFDPGGGPSSEIFPSPTPCPNRYRIIYTAGYSVVPPDLKLAVLQQAVFLYENRGNKEAGLSDTAQALAFPHKRQLWF